MYYADPSLSNTSAMRDVPPSPGHYDSPDALVKQINGTIISKESKKNLTRFSSNEISKKSPDAKFSTFRVMNKMFAELAGFILADVKSILSEHEDENTGKEEVGKWWKIKGIINRTITGFNVRDLQRGFYS